MLRTRQMLIILLALSLQSCASIRRNPAYQDALSRIDLSECRDAGGQIEDVGILQMPSCVIPFPDAGSDCIDSSGCEGNCLLHEQSVPAGTPVLGACQETNSLFGCFTFVEGGVAGDSLCVD